MIHIGICIPYYEHLECLKQTIQSYIEQGYDRNNKFRVTLFVVDDGSTLEPVEEAHLGPFDFTIEKLTKEPGDSSFRNPTVPRRRAIQQAITMNVDIIYMTQADISHPMDVLTTGVHEMGTYEPNGAFRVVKIPVKQDSKYKARNTGLNYDWQSHPKHRPVIYNANYLARPALFQRHGYYDDQYRKMGYGGYDLDYFLMLNQRGVDIRWHPSPYHCIHLYHEQKYTKNKEVRGKMVEYFKSKWGYTPQEYFKRIRDEAQG